VIETYQTTNDVPEALERLTEAYFAIGLTNEARASAAVLGYNFPDSQWYRYAYALLVQHGYGNDKGAKVQQASAQAPMTTTTARPAPAPSTPASVASAPTVQAAVPSNVAPVSAPTAQPEMASQPAPTEAAEVQPAPVVDQAPAPATESPATPEQAASARPGAHPTDMSAPTNADSEQKRRYRGYGADRDLADSWVRRLLRSLF